MKEIFRAKKPFSSSSGWWRNSTTWCYARSSLPPNSGQDCAPSRSKFSTREDNFWQARRVPPGGWRLEAPDPPIT